MHSVWVTLTFLVLVCVTTGAPVADNQRGSLDLPMVGDVVPDADVTASPSAAAVDVDPAGKDVLAQDNVKVLRPPRPMAGASLSPRDPQSLGSFLAGLSPTRGALHAAESLAQHSSSQNGSPTPSQQPRAHPPAFTSPQQLQGNNILPRDPQDLSKVLGIVFPPKPAPEPRSEGREASDSNDTPLASREPQIDKMLQIVTGAIIAPPPPPDSDTSRRWLVDTQVTSEESANVDNDSAMVPRQFGHADHHGPSHHPVHHGPPGRHDHHGLPGHHDHHESPHHPVHHGLPGHHDHRSIPEHHEHHEHHGPPHHPVHHGPPEHHDHHDHHAPHGIVIVGGGHHTPAASIHLGPSGLKISAHKG